MSGIGLAARLPASVEAVAHGAAFTHLPLRGQRRDRDHSSFEDNPHRLPCFTLSTRVTEHLKQAAKVRGLGVERQLKRGLTDDYLPLINYRPAILCKAVTNDIKEPCFSIKATHKNKDDDDARHDHQQPAPGIPAPDA
jgi:hypothetical protein